MYQTVRISALVVFVTIIFSLMTVFVYAQGTNQPNGGGTNQPTGGGALTNPLNSQTITEFLLKIIDVLLIFALPIIIIFIMYAGFLFVTARGNTEQISTARTALIWAVIGGVIALGAKVIIEVIQNTIKAF